MEAPIQQTQVEEGQAETTSAPQATETIDQPQTSTPSQVEGGQSTSQAQPGTPDYETARQIKNLVKEFRSFKQSFNPRSSEPPQAAPKPSVPQVTREELVQDPINAIKKILDGGKSEVRDDILKAIEEKESLRQKENLRQEGLRLIRTNELIRKDPNGEERMKEILLEEDDDGNSLEAYAQVNPKHAAQLALKEYQSRYGQGKNAFAPSKAQMASTATAQTAGAGRATTETEIGALYAQIATVPELMKDPQFMAKLDALVKKSDVESRVGK